MSLVLGFSYENIEGNVSLGTGEYIAYDNYGIKYDGNINNTKIFKSEKDYITFLYAKSKATGHNVEFLNKQHHCEYSDFINEFKGENMEKNYNVNLSN